MAEEKDNPSENIGNQEKILATKKKILELHEKEKNLRKELDKMSSKTVKDQQDQSKHLEKQKKLLDEIIKQKKTLQADLKESNKQRKQEEDSVTTVNDGLKQTIKSQEKLNDLKAKSGNGREEVNTILQANKGLLDQLKTLQSQQNLSTAYKKQKREELIQQIEINKEKLSALDIDKQAQKAILRNQSKQTQDVQRPAQPSAPKAKESIAPPIPDAGSEKAESAAAAYERSLSAARGIVEMAKEIAKQEGYYNDTQKQNIKLLEKSISLRESVEASIEAAIEEGRDLDDIEKSISKNVQSRIFTQNRLKELQSSGLVDVKSVLEKQKAIEKAMKDQELAESKVSEIRKRLISQGETDYEVIEKAIKAEQIKADAAASEVEQLKSKMHLHEIEYISLNKAVEEYNKVNDLLKKQREYQKEINDRMGLFGKSVKVLGGVLDHFGVGKFLKINEAIDAMREKAAAGGSKLSVMFTGLGNILKNVAKSLMDPVAIITGIVGLFTTLVKKAVEFQSKNFEAAKALGMSVSEAGKLRDRFDQIANKNGQLALTSGQLLETQQKMNEQLGFMAPSTEEFATQTTLIMRRFGASAESMSELQLYAAKSGKTLQSTFATVVGTGKAKAAQLKIAMTEKQILDEVSKVSSTVYSNFKGNVPALAAAVVEAKKMGMSLDQVNKIGDSLLDFESSMSKEMEAQLLTGKQIDMSKARELALAGNTAGLMKELNKQIGSQAQYEKMNVIQKQAYAEAIGMSREEMDKMFHEQKKAQELGALASESQSKQYSELVKKGKSHAEIAKIMGEESANSAQQASVQEKMATAMERVNEIIGKASQAFMPLIEKVVAFLSNTKNVEDIVHKIESGVKSVGSALMEAGRFIRDNMTLLKILAGIFVGIKVTMFTINKLQAAQNLAKKLGLGVSKQQSTKDKEILNTKKKQDLQEKKIGRSKKGNVTTSKTQGTVDKGTLNTTRIRNTTEKAIGSSKKKNIATSVLEGGKEKKNAGLSIVRAISSVTAGSGWMGPLALGVGIAAGTYLYSKLSSAGGGDSGGGDMGGGAGSAGAPAAPDKGMNPMNQAAETQKVVNTALVRNVKDVDRPTSTNLTVVNNVDPFTGKSLVKVISNDPSSYSDSSKIAATTRS
jgi:hypothetical protein